MTFPSFLEWVDTVLHPIDRAGSGGRWCFEDPGWHRTYANKHAVAKSVQATSMLEIGVRFGYAAHAFLTAGVTRYVGIDSDSPEHNGLGMPTCDWAFAALARNCPWCSTTLIRADTSKTDPTASLAMFDFVHVDGDHSFEGAYRDMQRGWRLCGRAMLVDDYNICSSVHDAVDHFARDTGALLFLSQSGTGEALFIK